jgi:hypothetical protein
VLSFRWGGAVGVPRSDATFRRDAIWRTSVSNLAAPWTAGTRSYLMVRSAEELHPDPSGSFLRAFHGAGLGHVLCGHLYCSLWLRLARAALPRWLFDLCRIPKIGQDVREREWAEVCQIRGREHTRRKEGTGGLSLERRAPEGRHL